MSKPHGNHGGDAWIDIPAKVTLRDDTFDDYTVKVFNKEGKLLRTEVYSCVHELKAIIKA